MSNLPTLAKGPVLLPGTFNKDAIVFIDAEVSPETGQIVDLGACRADGRFFHSSNVAAFKEFCKGADFVCGHNIVAFDMQYLRPSWATDRKPSIRCRCLPFFRASVFTTCSKTKSF